MTGRRIVVITALLAALAGAAFLQWIRSDGSAPPPPAEPYAASTPDPPDAARPMTVREWQSSLGGEAAAAADAPAPAPQTGTISMPIAAKLAPKPLSSVPHQLIGAWDEQPGSSRPGAHRTIVAVVDPSMPSPELEQLVWDIRERHDDAEILDVRIYDSAESATRSSALDGGAERMRHLVANVKRNDRLGFDQVTIRGQVVGP